MKTQGKFLKSLCIKNLFVLTSMLSASCVTAYENDINAVVGADYYLALMKGRDAYESIFPKSYSGLTLYVGTKFHEYWGVELGFDTAPNKNKDWVIPANSSFFNAASGGTDITGVTRLQRSGGHVDFIGYFPLGNCWDLTGSVGFGYIKPSVSVSILSGPAGGNALTTELAAINGVGKGFLRMGVGLSYMLTNIVGARVKVGFEGTSKLRLRGDQNFSNLGFSERGFKGSTTFSIGIFAKF